MSLPTLTDLRVHANITSTANDDELVEMLDAAVDVVGAIIGNLDTGSVTETHYGVASPTLLLRQMPVVEVTEVAIRSTGFAGSTVLPLDDYELDATAGVLRIATGGYFYGDVTITYTAGRSETSAAIRLATLIIASHLWETQRGTAPSALALQQADGDPGFNPGAGYAIPNRAQELLAPYVRSSIA